VASDSRESLRRRLSEPVRALTSSSAMAEGVELDEADFTLEEPLSGRERYARDYYVNSAASREQVKIESRPPVTGSMAGMHSFPF